MDELKRQFAIFTAMIVLFGAFLLLPVFQAHAGGFEIGSLNLEFADSDTEAADVEMTLRIAGRQALGAGMCSPYAWSFKVNDVKFSDLLAVCGLISGDISEDDAQARVSVGVSIANIAGIRTFIGFDPIHGGLSRGIGISATGTHDFFGK